MEKYCRNCGNKINYDADICINCGKRVNKRFKKDEKTIWFVLSFLAPIISIVLYLILKANKNISARIILLGILFRVLLFLLFSTICFLYVYSFIV